MKEHDPVRFGCRLALHATDALPAAGEIKKTLVVFVHGFTADCEYLKDHGGHIQRSGFESAYFHYDSYLGINDAAAMLASRLKSCEEAIRTHGIVLVGHSMGGLVVRALAAYHLEKLIESLRGMVLLGTPSGGTLMNSWVVRRMIDWGDTMSEKYALSPYVRSPTCRSAMELTQSDPEQFLKRLNDRERSKPAIVPTLTISGGMKFLEVGGGVWETIANYGLQWVFRGVQNDGLVPENSVDLTGVIGDARDRAHANGYGEYWKTNHTALAVNQSIQLLIVDFLKRIAPISKDGAL